MAIRNGVNGFVMMLIHCPVGAIVRPIATMRSFADLRRAYDGQPARIGFLLQHIDVGRGREELYRDQAPQLLRGRRPTGAYFSSRDSRRSLSTLPPVCSSGQ